MWPFSNGWEDIECWERIGRCQEENCGCRKYPAPTGCTRSDGPAYTQIQWGCPQFEDWGSQHLDPGRGSSPSCTPGTRGHQPDFSILPILSGLNQSQSRGWMAKLKMVIQCKHSSFPDELSKMQYAFSCLWAVALEQTLPDVWKDRKIELGDQPAFIRLLEAVFGDPDRVATAEQTISKIKQMNQKFSQYYPEFRVISPNVD